MLLMSDDVVHCSAVCGGGGGVEFQDCMFMLMRREWYEETRVPGKAWRLATFGVVPRISDLY